MFDIRWPEIGRVLSAFWLNEEIARVSRTCLLAGAPYGSVVLVQDYADLIHEPYLLRIVACQVVVL